MTEGSTNPAVTDGSYLRIDDLLALQHTLTCVLTMTLHLRTTVGHNSCPDLWEIRDQL